MNLADKFFGYLRTTSLILTSLISFFLGIFTFVHRTDFWAIAGFKTYPVALIYTLPFDISFTVEIWVIYGFIYLLLAGICLILILFESETKSPQFNISLLPTLKL